MIQQPAYNFNVFSHPSFTGEQCLEHQQGRVCKTWSLEEDDIILNLAKTTSSWQIIAQQMRQIFGKVYSSPQISQHYRRVLCKGSTVWSDSELDKLGELVKVMPGCWAEIGRQLGKADAQVKQKAKSLMCFMYK
ncbi:hypothetical protein SS50377_21522 [Spironucleus salmonicida]|uniref:Myb-like domain-containing protein n=1 Tax=Spironucleus salmonicida TaxID=348837 RepID=V6LP59_9EUKA|nr:hypothetical protein SS50377_21522 [Spironucleus salmonicida]|eukprot:EST45501.1 Hypothetical protein SS50377_14573 [Spironucleus salmonicida]